MKDSFDMYDSLVKSKDSKLLKQMGKDSVQPKAWMNDPENLLNSMGFGYKTPPSSLTYSTLYSMAKKNHVVAIVHKTLKKLVVNYCRKPKHKYDEGFKIKHKYLKDWELKPRHKKSAELLHRRDGKLHSMWYVPSHTVRLAAPKSKTGRAPTKKEVKTVPKYVQIYNNRVLNKWTESEFLWAVANPRTTLYGHGYGLSELELLIVAVTAELWAEEWNVNSFKNGSSLKGIFNIKGNISKEKMEDLRRQWLMQASGVHNAWRQVFMNAEGLDFVPLNLSNEEMGYNQWLRFLTYIICLMYQIPPEICGFKFPSPGMRAGGGQYKTHDQRADASDRYLRPLLQQYEEMFNSPKIMGSLDPDYEFQWYGVDQPQEEKDIENRNKELQFFKTFNEVRRENGLPEKEGWDIPSNAVLTSYLNQQKAMDIEEEQREKAEQMQEQQMQQQQTEEEGGEETLVDASTREEMFAQDDQSSRVKPGGEDATSKSLFSQLRSEFYDVI